MSTSETELEMAQRHVAKGRALVERQQHILAELRRDGHPTESAERLLADLEHTQHLHEKHLIRLIG